MTKPADGSGAARQVTQQDGSPTLPEAWSPDGSTLIYTIGAAATSGRNTIEVRVANLWVNRLIGDKQPGATPVAFVAIPTYKPDAPLRPSGLIGPVTLSVRAD